MRSARVAALLAVVLVSCSTQGAPATSAGTTSTAGVTTTVAPATTLATTTTPAPAPLPPHTFEALAPLLDPLVAPLGFRVTRASLVDLGTYESSPDGTHLAVYVEPLTPRDNESVAASTVPVAAAFLPAVFLRWSGLESFDVCQERFGSADGAAAPPDTILNLTREAALDIDWATVTLSQLLAADATELSLYADEAIRLSTTWSQAEAAQP